LALDFLSYKRQFVVIVFSIFLFCLGKLTDRLAKQLLKFYRYLPGPDDMLVLDIAFSIYLKSEEFPNALQIALFMDNLLVRH